MTRIAKADVHTTLDRIGQNIKDAAGNNGVTSRAEIAAKVQTLSGTEAQLTDRFFRFIDHRDHKPGARITGADVDRAVAYAKQQLISDYDVNQNGLSKSEVAKMSVIGQLSVKLTAEIKGVAAPTPSPSTSPLAQAFAAAAKDTYYVSETDSQPAFVSTRMPSGTLSAANVYAAFKDELAKAFDEPAGDLSAYTFEAADKGFLGDVAKDYADPTLDSSYHDYAKGFARLQGVVDDNLKDVVAIRVGPKDTDGSLATDRGAYQYLVVGKTTDNKLAGVLFESVET
jgi:hypothetical protein